MTDLTMPTTEPERSAWRAGARAEAALRYDGMSDSAREVVEFVDVVAGQGGTADDLVDYTARVFTAGWPLRRRLALAWRLLRG